MPLLSFLYILPSTYNTLHTNRAMNQFVRILVLISAIHNMYISELLLCKYTISHFRYLSLKAKKNSEVTLKVQPPVRIDLFTVKIVSSINYTQ